MPRRSRRSAALAWFAAACLSGTACDAGNSSGCTEGDARPCYEGTTGTEDVGACTGGQQSCTGGQWGECLGQILPSAESCDGLDDDCNGATDDGVACCTGADTRPCYEGPPGTENVGACTAGQQACAGEQWGECLGQVLPAVESCNALDDDCDGAADDGLVCPCTGSETRSCYDGPSGTVDVGECTAGLQTCSGAQWGACQGQVLPTAETTFNGQDDDCDGYVDGCANTNPACATFADTPTVFLSGDVGTPLVGSVTGTTEQWFRVRFREDGGPLDGNDVMGDLSLTSSHYDMFVYCEPCGGAPFAQALASPLIPTLSTLSVVAHETLQSDGFNLLVEIRLREPYPACAPWRVDMLGSFATYPPLVTVPAACH